MFLGLISWFFGLVFFLGWWLGGFFFVGGCF